MKSNCEMSYWEFLKYTNSQSQYTITKGDATCAAAMNWKKEKRIRLQFSGVIMTVNHDDA